MDYFQIFNTASSLYEMFYQFSSIMDALSSQICSVRLFILQKDLRRLRKAEMASRHPVSQWRNRNRTQGSCMPQFRKHILFLPQPLANITGIPSVLNGICNSNCVFLKTLLETGWKFVTKQMNAWRRSPFLMFFRRKLWVASAIVH